jgi:hypothetical protein
MVETEHNSPSPGGRGRGEGESNVNFAADLRTRIFEMKDIR